MKLLFCAICSFLYLFINVLSLKSQRIIGGQDAIAGQYPFAAAITVQTENSRHFCGGSLMAPQWVLTSGICVNNATLLTIQLGSTSLTEDDPNRIIVASSEYIVHPEFNPDTIANDLALIKLRMPVSFTDYIQPIYVPTIELFNFSTVAAIGWGQTSDSESYLSEQLQYVYVYGINNDLCKIIYGDQIHENMGCVKGNYNEGTCTGDNGGALVQYLRLYVWVIGVASFISSNGCESTNPSGYTRTYPYAAWIGSIINS